MIFLMKRCFSDYSQFFTTFVTLVSKRRIFGQNNVPQTFSLLKYAFNDVLNFNIGDQLTEY